MAQGPDLSIRQWFRLLTMPGMGMYNSAMAGIEQLRFGKAIRETKIEKPPVFILGFWRSGTTLLHNLITSDPQFTYPTMYQTVFPWHFLTTEGFGSRLTSWMVPDSRPMDNIKVNWASPQEDDVALCIMSMLSPYTLLTFAKDLETYRRSLTVHDLPEKEKKSWMDSLTLLMKKMTILNNKPIVLKSPSHTYRVRILTEMFPDAKFVYIYRNPLDVFNSTCHLRRTMIEENTLGVPHFTTVEEDIIRSYNEAFDSYHQERHLIADGNLHEIRYEDLANEPFEEIEKLYGALNLDGFETAAEILKPQVPKLKNYKKNSFPVDEHWMQQVYEQCRPAYDKFGYPAPSAAEMAAA